ncbi:UDP-N-acetylglucosamine pyrophosphorylase [Ruminococcaceae bacterium OttesenSCG-928-A16]|nr:UDP-N-acetylglucosamine pyrophosphorylase [Ruminococcaceae bacterium OttesenSCG-928-A16]
MAIYQTNELFDLDKTIAGPLLAKAQYPWQALPGIGAFITTLGNTLPADTFTKIGPDIWVAKTATVAASALLTGPCIIDEEAEVRHGAFIRGNAIVGKRAVVGNSTELKNCILFDEVQAPHFNYVGDSILGYKSHLGAGAVTSNVKSDKTQVVVRDGEDAAETGRTKVGAMVGDYAEVGCNSVLNPGTVLGRHCNIYPLSSVRGTVPQNSILKTGGNVIIKK